MVYRLPSQLETFVPPPTSQSDNSIQSSYMRPWRGLFLVSGTRASDLGSNVEIRVTAVETDGDIQSHLWPLRFVFSIAVPHALPILSQVQNYMRSRSPPVPVTTFLPERLRDLDRNTVNQTHFRSLSRLLWENQLVAIVPISLPDRSTRHGMLILPSSNSSAILLGIMFLTPEDTLPDFVLTAQTSSGPSSSSGLSQASATVSPTVSAQTTAYGASLDMGASVPISPTVISSQSRHYQKQRMSPSLHYPPPSPSIRISTQSRYSPIAPALPQGQRFRSLSVNASTPGTLRPSSYSFAAPIAPSPTDEVVLNDPHQPTSAGYSTPSDSSLRQSSAQAYSMGSHDITRRRSQTRYSE